MKIGFLTACLPGVPLERLVPWAAAQGFDALEVADWPDDRRDHTPPRHLGAGAFIRDDARRLRDLLAEHDVSISALAYYDNNLEPDPARRARYHAHLRHLVDAAALLEIGLVGTFVGARTEWAMHDMKEIGRIFRDLVAYAGDRGVRLMIENCPMDNWVTFGLPGNYAYSPALWDALFDEVPDPGFGLNFDPSHLHWLGIDPERAARDYADRIFHVHAKDAEVDAEGRYRHGVLGERLAGDRWRSGWWRYRMPGRGGIDWASFLRTLHTTGYDGVLSIEHEDPDYEGSEDAVKEGLRLGLDHLKRASSTANGQ